MRRSSNLTSSLSRALEISITNDQTNPVKPRSRLHVRPRRRDGSRPVVVFCQESGVNLARYVTKKQGDVFFCIVSSGILAASRDDLNTSKGLHGIAFQLRGTTTGWAIGLAASNGIVLSLSRKAPTSAFVCAGASSPYSAHLHLLAIWERQWRSFEDLETLLPINLT